MAELVDALDSKSGFSNGVQVRFLFRALKPNLKTLIPQGFQGFCFLIWDDFGTEIGQIKANGLRVEWNFSGLSFFTPQYYLLTIHSNHLTIFKKI
jgi:hypothetical protein